MIARLLAVGRQIFAGYKKSYAGKRSSFTRMEFSNTQDIVTINYR
nr:MAG TPA: hypothetical protein [Podoviridae sp. ctAV815]